MQRSRLPRRLPVRQRGAILVVTLMFLLVVTMLAITSLQVSTSEERMAGNLKDWNIAMQAAESALRDAEFDIYSVCSINTSTCTKRSPAVTGQTLFGNQGGAVAPGTCNQASSYKGACLPPVGTLVGSLTNYALLNTSTWPGTLNPVAYGFYTGATALPTTGISGVAQQPQYIVEAMTITDVQFGSETVYRITARGWGHNSNTQVTLQSIWRQPQSVH